MYRKASGKQEMHNGSLVISSKSPKGLNENSPGFYPGKINVRKKQKPEGLQLFPVSKIPAIKQRTDFKSLFTNKYFDTHTTI